jgi:SPX domain protein involved in polyphosphate accumulation
MVSNTENIANRSDDWRFETKFVPDGVALQSVVALVKHHRCLFREAHYLRKVNNVYLDTNCLHFYNDNRSGIAGRTKVRIRWYGDSLSELNPILEYKIKSGLSGRKFSFSLPTCSIAEFYNIRLLRALFDRADVPEVVREDLRCIRPWVRNSYWRRYYVSADQKFRVTVDTDLLYGAMDYLRGGKPMAFRDHDKIVVELKYHRDNRSEAGRCFIGFPFRVEKCSKYVRGLERVLDLCSFG